MTLWGVILLACAATYLIKLAGYAVPARWLHNPRMARGAGAITVALLSALTVMNTFASGAALVLDAEQRGTKMIMQVHDELVFEVPQAEVDWVRTEIPRLMAGVADLKVPLLAEIGVGENWEKAH